MCLHARVESGNDLNEIMFILFQNRLKIKFLVSRNCVSVSIYKYDRTCMCDASCLSPNNGTCKTCETYVYVFVGFLIY